MALAHLRQAAGYSAKENKIARLLYLQLWELSPDCRYYSFNEQNLFYPAQDVKLKCVWVREKIACDLIVLRTQLLHIAIINCMAFLQITQGNFHLLLSQF